MYKLSLHTNIAITFAIVMYPFGYECNLVLKVTIAYRKSVNNGNNEVKIFLYPR